MWKEREKFETNNKKYKANLKGYETAKARYKSLRARYKTKMNKLLKELSAFLLYEQHSPYEIAFTIKDTMRVRNDRMVLNRHEIKQKALEHQADKGINKLLK